MFDRLSLREADREIFASSYQTESVSTGMRGRLMVFKNVRYLGYTDAGLGILSFCSPDTLEISQLREMLS